MCQNIYLCSYKQSNVELVENYVNVIVNVEVHTIYIYRYNKVYLSLQWVRFYVIQLALFYINFLKIVIIKGWQMDVRLDVLRLGQWYQSSFTKWPATSISDFHSWLPCISYQNIAQSYVYRYIYNLMTSYRWLQAEKPKMALMDW